MADMTEHSGIPIVMSLQVLCAMHQLPLTKTTNLT